MAEADVSNLSSQQIKTQFPFKYEIGITTSVKGNIDDPVLREKANNALSAGITTTADKVVGSGNYVLGSGVTFYDKSTSAPGFVVATKQLEIRTTEKLSDDKLKPVDAGPGNGTTTGPTTGMVFPGKDQPPTETTTTETTSNTGDNEASDDSGTGSASGTGTTDGSNTGDGSGGTASNVTYNKPIEREAANRRTYNPLKNYSSVTYVVSLYALPPKALANFNNTGQWDTTKMELLIQTGGINPALGQKRNKYFNYDFTIDDLEITSIINTKETQFASNSIDFRFKVYEPYSMTFPTRLAEVQKEISKQIGLEVEQPVKALAAPLLLVVKFYGYDKDGRLAYSDPIGNQATSFSTTASKNGAFERAFPIFINKLNFKLESKVTVYDITAKSVNMQAGFGTKRGVIDGATDINAETVEDAVKQIIETFNKKQQELSTGDNKKQEYPDKYDYKILSPLIGEAFIADQGTVKSKTGMLIVKNSLEANVKNSSKVYPINRAKRNVQFASGTPIMKALDTIITQSTFIGDSLTIIDLEETPANEQDKEAYSNPKPKELYWYNITPQVTMQEQYDTIRKDYAYNITYVIQTYRVPYVRTLSANSFSSYPGPHKEYSYFYTGENTEILNYEQQYNLLYYLVASSTTEAAIKNTDASVSSAAKPTTGASPIGKESNKNEVVNNIRTFLYSPGDQIKAQIKILGDPDFLMPSIATPAIVEADKFYGPDYTINPNSGQVFIEIEFQQVEDYGYVNDGQEALIENDNGLLTPNGHIYFWDYPDTVKGVASNTMIYVVTHVISKFSRGVFTQDLKTILPNFPKVDKRKDTTRLTDTPVATHRIEKMRTSADFQKSDKDTRPVPLPGLQLNGKPNLAPANPDDPGQSRILTDLLNKEGRPVLIDKSDIDPVTLLPKRRP